MVLVVLGLEAVLLLPFARYRCSFLGRGERAPARCQHIEAEIARRRTAFEGVRTARHCAQHACSRVDEPAHPGIRRHRAARAPSPTRRTGRRTSDDRAAAEHERLYGVNGVIVRRRQALVPKARIGFGQLGLVGRSPSSRGGGCGPPACRRRLRHHLASTTGRRLLRQVRLLQPSC